jgi:shikimate kinase
MAAAEELPHVAIVGLMASGKTSVGRIVAHHLGRPYLDSDELIRERTGMTVAELWRRGGEDAYRPHEREVVTQTLAGPGPDVLGVPAGAIDDEAATASLDGPSVFVVWLRAEVETLVGRVQEAQGDDHRPLLDEDPRAVLERQAAERSGRYLASADVVLDVEGRSAEELATAVVAALAARS